MSPRTTSLPIIEPILVVTGSPPLHDSNWLYEPKYDGFRGNLYLNGREALFRSKRGNVLRRFGELAQRFRAELTVRNAILDGEVVCLDDAATRGTDPEEQRDSAHIRLYGTEKIEVAVASTFADHKC